MLLKFVWWCTSDFLLWGHFVLDELDSCCVVSISLAAAEHPEPPPADSVDHRATVLEVLNVANLKHGPVIRKPKNKANQLNSSESEKLDRILLEDPNSAGNKVCPGTTKTIAFSTNAPSRLRPMFLTSFWDLLVLLKLDRILLRELLMIWNNWLTERRRWSCMTCRMPLSPTPWPSWSWVCTWARRCEGGTGCWERQWCKRRRGWRQCCYPQPQPSHSLKRNGNFWNITPTNVNNSSLKIRSGHYLNFLPDMGQLTINQLIFTH